MKKEAIKRLWKRCFDDCDAFVDLYFELRYSEEVNIALTDGEEVIAALQTLPYPMTFCNTTIPTSYVSGACTDPTHRKRGAMRELLSRAFRQMHQRGELISTLIPGEPWLFDYYQRMGYAAVFRQTRRTLQIPATSGSVEIVVRSTNQYEAAVYQYLNDKMRERTCCIQHTNEDFQVLIAELIRTKSAIYVATQQENIVGVALTGQLPEKIEVQELLAESREIADELIRQIGQTTGCKEIELIAPSSPGMEGRPLGMARIINAQAVLQLYATAHPQTTLCMKLIDEQLPANSGYYLLREGSSTYRQTPFQESHIELDSRALTEKILTPLQPYMSLMLN